MSDKLEIRQNSYCKIVLSTEETEMTASIWHNVGDGEGSEFLDNEKQALKCAEHLKTIMIAVKEGADVEVVVSRLEENALAQNSLEPENAWKLQVSSPTAGAFDHYLHSTIMQLAQVMSSQYSIEYIIECATKIVNTCKIKP